MKSYAKAMQKAMKCIGLDMRNLSAANPARAKGMCMQPKEFHQRRSETTLMAAPDNKVILSATMWEPPRGQRIAKMRFEIKRVVIISHFK